MGGNGSDRTLGDCFLPLGDYANIYYMPSPHKPASGFTIMEILIVLAIISILSGLFYPTLIASRDRANVVKAATDLRQITLALSLYYDVNGVYPCFDENWSDVKEQIWSEPFLSKWPKQPTSWGGRTYHWANSQWERYSISLDTPGQSNELELDKLIDDGNPATGKLIWKGNGRAEWGGMDQSVPLVIVACP